MIEEKYLKYLKDGIYIRVTQTANTRYKIINIEEHEQKITVYREFMAGINIDKQDLWEGLSNNKVVLYRKFPNDKDFHDDILEFSKSYYRLRKLKDME